MRTSSSSCGPLPLVDELRAYRASVAVEMAFLQIPDPYDFELSSERYRRWGRDPANLWEDGALWRALDGREVRIVAADGGVDVQPLDAATGATVLKLLGTEFDLDAFYAF